MLSNAFRVTGILYIQSLLFLCAPYSLRLSLTFLSRVTINASNTPETFII